MYEAFRTLGRHTVYEALRALDLRTEYKEPRTLGRHTVNEAL